MRNLRSFSIPIKGLGIGIREFEFFVDHDFFNHFEKSFVKNGQFKIDLEFSRKSNHITLDFLIEGYVQTNCDRCTVLINIPIRDNSSIIVKYAEEEKPSEGDVIYIHPESHEINVAKLIYEIILVSVPISKTYDCQEEDPLPCDQNVLNILSSPKKKDESNIGSLGEALKGLDLN